MKRTNKALSSILCVMLSSSSVLADEVQIVDATAQCFIKKGTCDFQVTLKHADTGWEHYASAYSIHAPDGRNLGERILRHPHVEEQPFTRSLEGVKIENSLKSVVIKAKDSVHGVSQHTYDLVLDWE